MVFIISVDLLTKIETIHYTLNVSIKRGFIDEKNIYAQSNVMKLFFTSEYQLLNHVDVDRSQHLHYIRHLSKIIHYAIQYRRQMHARKRGEFMEQV